MQRKEEKVCNGVVFEAGGRELEKVTFTSGFFRKRSFLEKKQALFEKECFLFNKKKHILHF